MITSFRKVNGLGNDFVVFDARRAALSWTPRQAQLLADRHIGIGGDQVLTLRPSERADVYMQIQNIDGSEVNACGNAARCVARLLWEEEAYQSRAQVRIETAAGVLSAELAAGGVSLDLGEPRFEWQHVPLSRPVDTLHVDLTWGPAGAPVVHDAVALNMGNPHAVFFVDDVSRLPIEEIGPSLEHHAWFPQRANIGFAQVLSRSGIRLRVWERHAGLTRACGTGACAALVAASRRGLTGRSATLYLDGGALEIDWRDNNHVITTGATMVGFDGTLAPDLIARLRRAADDDFTGGA